MRILKLLNKKFFLIIFAYSFSFILVLADEKPIDIWNIEEQETEIKVENSLSNESKEISSENNIYKLQSKKPEETIELDKELSLTNIKIVGLYDPQDYGLSIDMWSNSDGLKLKTLFKNIEKSKLSKDASEIMQVSLLTNAYYPNQNITEQEFMVYKSDWLIKNTDLELIEEYLLKNETINLHPKLTKHLVDSYLSEANVKKACEIFSKNNEALEDEYLSKFNLYCLINYGKNEEAQLILDLKKELGFEDYYYENKINYLFGYIEEVDKEVSIDSILDFHLAHRTNPDFSYEPTKETPNLIWKYLSASNLLFKIQDLEIYSPFVLADINKISSIEKAVHEKIFSENDLYEFYKKFEFNINQLLNAKEDYKSLSNIEGRALLYQRILLAKEPKLKLELIKTLKNLFDEDKISNGFNLELKKFLKQIDPLEVPPNYKTFYNENIRDDENQDKKIKYNSKILHQSKLLNYFSGNYAKSKIEEDLEKFLMKIKQDNSYLLSKKDIIFLEALKSDGVKISNKFDDLYEIKEISIPLDIQKMIDNKEIGAALLRVIEEIGAKRIENIDEDTIYLIINTLNQLNIDVIRNKLLLKVLPLKV